MKPVARVRWSPGSRSASGFGEANAAALRGRFEQLMRGSGEDVPGVSQTLSSHGAPPPTSRRSAGLDALVEPRPQPLEVESSPRGTRDKKAAIDSNQTVRAELSKDHPSIPHGEQLAVALPQTCAVPLVCAPSLDTSEHAALAHTSRTPDSSEPPPLLPPLNAQPTDLQPPPQPPTARAERARGAARELPALVRDLVQAVVHMSRGREGQWRLTMALKPQVLEGTLVALEAQPGRLQVRFDCTGNDACTRLTAVRDDLRLRLTEALSAARPVDVRVDVQAGAHDVV
jgi:Type III secretion protein (HpaP)